MKDDKALQQKLDQGIPLQGEQADAYRTLFAHLEQPQSESIPRGFSFRVMDKLVHIRLRRAEQQARRASYVSSMGLVGLAGLALFGSIEFGWIEATWTAQLPLQSFMALGLGLMLLGLLDSLFEAKIQ